MRRGQANGLFGKIIVKFPTARLDNTKVVVYIIRMRYLHVNTKWVLTLFFFELGDQQIFVVLCGPPRPKGGGGKIVTANR